ncbi:hypothetical protein ES703_61019 [subsurface metagenome]
MKDKWDENCRSCQAFQGLISITNTPTILATPHWVVEHVYPTSIKGWLVVALKRHCRALHDLTREEMQEFGELLSIICQGLHTVMRTESEYVVQFAEGEGYHHVHFHVIARLPQWPETLRGWRVISGAGKAVTNPLQSEDLTPLVLEIREYLKKKLPADLQIA